MKRVLIAYREKNLKGDFSSQAYWVLQELGQTLPGIPLYIDQGESVVGTIKKFFGSTFPESSSAADTVYLFDQSWDVGGASFHLVHMELGPDEISALSVKGIEPRRMPDILRSMPANKLRLPILQAFQLLMGADKIEIQAELTKN